MNMRIHIAAIDGTQMAAKINGTFALHDGDADEFPFEAIAFGRIGGQNIGAKLSESVMSNLKAAGHDPQDVIMQLQKSLLQGDLTLPKGLSREMFADDQSNKPDA